MSEDKARIIEEVNQKLGLGDAEGALSLLEPLEDMYPLTIDVVRLKAKALGAAGRAQEGLDIMFSFVEDYISALPPDPETLVVQASLYEQTGNLLWADYARYQLALISDDEAGLNERNELLYQAQKAALDSPVDAGLLYELADVYVKTQHHVAGMVVLALAAGYSGTKVSQTALYKAMASRWLNFASICELIEKKHPVTLIMDSDEDDCNAAVLAELLAVSGRDVHLLLPPVIEDMDSDSYDVGALAEVTVENAEHQGNLHMYRPIVLTNNGEMLCDNTVGVLDAIRGITSFTLLLCEYGLMDSVLSSSPLRLKGQRFSPNLRVGAPVAAAGYIGSYLTYIGHIHGSIASVPLPGKGRVGISVVIPTRDNAYALEHTLRTCLNQRIDDYEIVVCDNSSPGNEETRELIARLDDKKIRYVRPPRPLNLTKNFEHAVLNANGEFIFTMGSDDGLFFHGLEVMEAALKQLPDDDVVAWERCLYIWPDLSTSGQNGQFSVGAACTREITISIIESLDLLAGILVSRYSMYELPMLYINSGFRRRYIDRMLNETGRLWDGYSQDIYMGMVNLALNKTIPRVTSPLTIAGMCGKSMGARYQSGSSDVGETKKNDMELYTDNVGYCIPGSLEEIIATAGVDLSNLFQSYNRVAAMGISPDFVVEAVDWKNAFKQCVRYSSREDLKFDLYMRRLSHCAKLHSKELGEWFDGVVVPAAYMPQPIGRSGRSPAEKSFKSGFTKEGRLTLDAERFGVTNVYEACELFDKIFCL